MKFVAPNRYRPQGQKEVFLMEKIMQAVAEYRAAEAVVRQLDAENLRAVAEQQAARSRLSHAQDRRDDARRAMLEMLDADL